jgi:hypothetical protein
MDVDGDGGRRDLRMKDKPLGRNEKAAHIQGAQ